MRSRKASGGTESPTEQLPATGDYAGDSWYFPAADRSGPSAGPVLPAGRRPPVIGGECRDPGSAACYTPGDFHDPTRLHGNMTPYASLADDFYINMNLATEMELPAQRETILQYFERVQKRFPSMRKFYCRDKRDYVLEEDKDQGRYRWAAVESKRLCSGQVNPATLDAALDQHRLVLDLAPAFLSISPLDCEAIDVLFGFDFAYRGNHNALLAEALGVGPAFERLGDAPGGRVINYEPSLTIALDEDCRVQVRVSTETRTNAFQVRTGEFTEEQLSIYVTARQYGSLDPDTSYVDTMNRLATLAREVVDSCVVEQILRPLARTIALK